MTNANMTIREEIQAKIDKARATIATWEADIQALESSGILSKEKSEVVAWFQALAKHIGL